MTGPDILRWQTIMEPGIVRNSRPPWSCPSQPITPDVLCLRVNDVQDQVPVLKTRRPVRYTVCVPAKTPLTPVCVLYQPPPGLGVTATAIPTPLTSSTVMTRLVRPLVTVISAQPRTTRR